MWLVVEINNNEYICTEKPYKYNNSWFLPVDQDYNKLGIMFELPKGSIKKLIGKELTFNDEPFEYK